MPAEIWKVKLVVERRLQHIAALGYLVRFPVDQYRGHGQLSTLVTKGAVNSGGFFESSPFAT